MKLRNLIYILLLGMAAMLWSCANIGSPSGGPRDYTSPVVLKSNPAPRSVNFKGKKVTIQFDEIVAIKDQQKKEQEMAIRSCGIRDSLINFWS